VGRDLVLFVKAFQGCLEDWILAPLAFLIFPGLVKRLFLS
jgi:hypothetical protein